MLLLPVINTQPEHIRSTIMAADINESLRSEDLIEIQVRIQDPLLGLRNILRQFPPIRSKDSRTPPSRDPKHARMRPHKIDTLLTQDRSGMQHKRLRLNRKSLRKVPTPYLTHHINNPHSPPFK